MLRRRAPSALKKINEQQETTRLSTGRISKKIRRTNELLLDDAEIITIDSSDDEDTRARKENKIKIWNEPGMQKLHQLLEQCTKTLFEKTKPEFNSWISTVLHKPYVNPDTSYYGHSETFLQMRYK